MSVVLQEVTRRFGDAAVTVVHHGTLVAPLDTVPAGIRGARWLLRRADGRVAWPMLGAVIRRHRAVVVVDPGGVYEALAASGMFEQGPGTDVALASLGLAPTDVTHVVITHGHADHFAGALDGDGRLRLPNAVHVLPSADVSGAAAHPAAEAHSLRGVAAAAESAGRLRLVHGDETVCPGVLVVAAPGETPGHQVVVVPAPSGDFTFLGDLVHIGDEIDDIALVSFPDECDGAVLEAARARVFAAQGETPGTFVFAHGCLPGWGRVARVEGGWRWQPDEGLS